MQNLRERFDTRGWLNCFCSAWATTDNLTLLCCSRYVELLSCIQNSCISHLIHSGQGSHIDSISSSNTPQSLPLLYFMIHSRMFYLVSKYTLCSPYITCGKGAMPATHG